ncbi:MULTISPECIES: hypothetical protein [Methylobacterium]|uniref:hypothetical protein n=1 Tax=Methylobacterium TaxID=407 RepID=UPI001047A13F|nr:MULTISPECIES: hypothetical protein [Methylobacterium]MDR7039289.1 hypothetical protein [Methylobacterium sp. BE186]
MVEITLQPVQIGTLTADTDGRLVFADGKLVAVLVRLSEELHSADGNAGQWCVEAGFGACEVGMLAVRFDSLEAARSWVADQISTKAPAM